MFYVPIEMTKEYVRENEVYAAKDGEIIRITPDMIKKVIRDGVMTEVYFAEVSSVVADSVAGREAEQQYITCLMWCLSPRNSNINANCASSVSFLSTRTPLLSRISPRISVANSVVIRAISRSPV